MDIPCLYLVDIHGISKVIPCISSLMDVHGLSKDIPCSIYHVYVGDLHIRGMYQAYSRHIPEIRVPDAEYLLYLGAASQGFSSWQGPDTRPGRYMTRHSPSRRSPVTVTAQVRRPESL